MRARGRGFSCGCGPWWATRDSNPDELRHTPLKRERLPVPPGGRMGRLILPKESGPESVENLIRRERWYPLQDSNSQPPDPKSGALSIELSGRAPIVVSRPNRTFGSKRAKWHAVFRAFGASRAKNLSRRRVRRWRP